MSVTVLLVYGGQPGGRTERLCTAALAGLRAAGEAFELRERPALQATVDDLLWAQGILLATPEHFGYMSGALKHSLTGPSTRPRAEPKDGRTV
jgi:multimeric flavodoxin WrbA